MKKSRIRISIPTTYGTEFPEASGNMMGMKTVLTDYPHDEVNDWIQRCMKDFPRPPSAFMDEYNDAQPYVVWYGKWFKQFMETDSP